MCNQSAEISEIIELAWCDKTSFDDIKQLTDIPESEVIKIMRRNLKPSSFRLWRKRVSGRTKKHAKLSTVKPYRGEFKG
ncbi:TIGR03643 family protein [Kordiimonas sp. SCSIO 12603]|uniref:TIGR03643 family protein n=1 Tax=Kordiimonas sp. SCSIO 12603 TaxID=2829596 RepID=UPI0021059C9C|nr:TIGR03643 family protein [Kordiimonas sp. SCSIO 12603]UTW57963.1 TIGR03643 family protein [Kordiimonas sp. SCSIO 12603]